MTIKEKIKRRRRRKAADKAIRNMYEYLEKVVDELCISIGDSLAEVKIRGNATKIEDEQDDE